MSVCLGKRQANALFIHTQSFYSTKYHGKTGGTMNAIAKLFFSQDCRIFQWESISGDLQSNLLPKAGANWKPWDLHWNCNLHTERSWSHDKSACLMGWVLAEKQLDFVQICLPGASIKHKNIDTTSGCANLEEVLGHHSHNSLATAFP